MSELKNYTGRVPACGVFCGGCLMYIREKRTCPGAEINCARCENCKSYHQCCKSRGINHCYECNIFPCAKYKRFTKSWEKYGQNLIDNQILLKEMGEEEFLKIYNAKVK